VVYIKTIFQQNHTSSYIDVGGEQKEDEEVRREVSQEEDEEFQAEDKEDEEVRREVSQAEDEEEDDVMNTPMYEV
jgi:low affinity Fe/Cu permease